MTILGRARFVYGAKRDANDGAIACGSGRRRTADGQHGSAVLLARKPYLRDDASDADRRGIVDQDLTLTSPRYEFSIASADATAFQAQARRRLFDTFGTPIYNRSLARHLHDRRNRGDCWHRDGPASTISGTTPLLTPAF